MSDVRSETATDRSLERADHGREQSHPTGSLRLSDTYEMGFIYLVALTQEGPLATRHCSHISTRFCPKGRSHTKHNTKPCLPGSRIAHFASRMAERDAHRHAPTSIANALSNRELSTNPCRANSHFPTEFFANSSACLTFLTGSALQTEFAVTHSKQTTGTFLTGSRFARYGAGIDSFSHLAQHGAQSK